MPVFTALRHILYYYPVLISGERNILPVVFDLSAQQLAVIFHYYIGYHCCAVSVHENMMKGKYYHAAVFTNNKVKPYERIPLNVKSFFKLLCIYFISEQFYFLISYRFVKFKGYCTLVYNNAFRHIYFIIYHIGAEYFVFV